MSEILGPNGCPMVERAPRRQVTAERSREKLIRAVNALLLGEKPVFGK